MISRSVRSRSDCRIGAAGLAPAVASTAAAAGRRAVGARAGRRAPRLLPHPVKHSIEGLLRHAEPEGEGVEGLVNLDFKAQSMGRRHAHSGCPAPTRPPAASPRSSRGRTAPRRGPARKPGDRRPARPGAERVGPLLQQEIARVQVRRQGEHAQVQLACPGTAPATGPPPIGRLHPRQRPGRPVPPTGAAPRRWSWPSAVPRVPTTLASPT